MPSRLLAFILTSISAQASVLLDDTWADATRDNTALSAESAWHASSSTSLTAAAGSLTGTTASGSSRSWWTHFTDTPAVPVSLLPDETLKVTLHFTPTGVNSTNSSRALRIGLFDFSGGTRTTTDGSSPAGAGVTGYALNLNFGQTFGVAGPISIRKRTDVSSSDLMGSAGDFTTLPDGDGGAADGSPGFVSDALHTLEWSITRTAAGAEITATFSRSDGWSITHTATDNSPVETFDGFALRPANNTQTATQFIFSRITVEKLNTVPPGPPVIGTHPQSQNVPAGNSVILNASASGTPPITWKWRRNGADLPGETAATLSLTNLQIGGTYTAVAENSFDSTESDPAVLTVTPQAPVFTLHPQPVAATAGSTVTLTAAARGTEPIDWKWTLDGSPVDGETGPSLTLPNVQQPSTGVYRAIATNTVNETQSDPAGLTITTYTAPPGIYVAPDGTAAAPGTVAQPTTLAEAVTRVAPGGVIYLRGGIYTYNTQVTIARGNNGGNEMLRKRILAFIPANGLPEEPILDFSSQPYGSTSSVSNPRGLMVGGDWWHIRGLTVKGAADNGIYVAGNNNIVELCRTHSCRDSGLQISRYQSSDGPALWPSFNLILNCESWDNYDSPPNGGENADGFACKLTSGDGNVFRGCIAHHNIDDGWDLFTKTETGPIGSVVIDRCIAYANGTLTDGSSNTNGDRNGFKLGGSGMPVVHTVTRSMAYSNGKNGITWNSNPAAIRLVGNLCFNNAQGNFKFDQAGPVFYNNASLYTAGNGVNDRYGGASGAPTGANCFWYVGSSSRGPSINDAGITISAASFQSLTPPLTWPRNADGSIDFGNFARPVTSHGIIDGGVLPPDIPLPFDISYYHGAPDIGLVEYRAGWQLWRELQFGEDALFLPHTAADAISSAGQPNALHYLLGFDADTAIPPTLLPKTVGSGAFRWFRKTSAGDMTAIPFTSTTLSGWSPLGTQLINTAGQMQEWEAVFPSSPDPTGFTAWLSPPNEMKQFLTTLPRSIGLRIGILGFLFPVALTAAPEPENTIWQLTRTDQIGGLVPEVMGAPKPQSEPVKALSFNGESDGLLVPVNPLAGCAKFTVEILISPESGGGEEQRFFHAEDTAGARALLELRVLPDGKWCLDSFLRAGKTSCVLLDRSKAHPPDRWHWVAMSYDGETLTSFVNGVRELSGKVAFPVMTEGRVSLGVRQNKVSWFKGAIREVRFHSTALTAEKLQSVVPAE